MNKALGVAMTRVGGKVPRNGGDAIAILEAMRANGEMVTATIDTRTSELGFEAYSRIQCSAFFGRGHSGDGRHF